MAMYVAIAICLSMLSQRIIRGKKALPHTISQEWRLAHKQYNKEQMWLAIRRYKPGTAVEIPARVKNTKPIQS